MTILAGLLLSHDMKGGVGLQVPASVVFLAYYVQIALLQYSLNGGKDHSGMISWKHRY